MSLDTARRVLRIEAQAIQDVLARLDGSFERAVELLLACKGRVVVSGMGKSGLVGRKISATLSSTGTPSFFLHPADALHGDLGMLARGDALLAITYGGETQEILNLLESLKDWKFPVVTLTGNEIHACGSERRGAGRQRKGRSVLAESCADGEHYSGDGGGRCAGRFSAGAARISARRFCGTAPGGAIGEKVVAGGAPDAWGRCAAASFAGDADARGVSRDVHEEAGDDDGDDGGRKAGRNSDRWRFAAADGKTRRRDAFDESGRLHGADAQTIRPKVLASEALNLMEKRKITSVVVVDDAQRVVGVVHLHDLWTLELI